MTALGNIVASEVPFDSVVFLTRLALFLWSLVLVLATQLIP